MSCRMSGVPRITSIYARTTQRSGANRDRPARATRSANTRLSAITTNVSSMVISSPARIGPKLSTATSGRKSSTLLWLQLEQHQVPVRQPVLAQHRADLAVGPQLGQSLGVGGAQRAILLADREPRHPVAAAIDDRRRHGDVPEPDHVVPRVLLLEF